MGVAVSLRVGFLVCLLARISIFLTSSKSMLLFQVLFVLPMGNSLGIPVLTTAVRRYTQESNRGFAFGLFYVVMNVAALFSGPVVDFCTILHKTPNDTLTIKNMTDIVKDSTISNMSENETILQWEFSGYRMVVLAGIIANVLACMISFTSR